MFEVQKLKVQVEHLEHRLSNLRTDNQVATLSKEDYNLQTDIDELHETMFSDPWGDFLP